MTRASLTPEAGSRPTTGLSSEGAARTKASLTAGVSTRALAAIVSEGGDRTKASLLGEASKRSPNTAWGALGGARITLDTMSFSAALQDLGFTVTEPGVTTMTLDTITLAATLQAVELTRSFRMTAAQMAVAATLQDLGLRKTRHVMTLDPISFQATLQDLTLTPPAGAGIALEQEVFADFDSSTDPWTKNVTFDGSENLVIVALPRNDQDVDSLTLAGSISLSRIVTIGMGAQNVDFWGVYDFTPQTGSKQISAGFSGLFGSSGSMGIWTFSGASRLPTTGDFDTDSPFIATTAEADLTIEAGETAIIIGALSLSTGPGVAGAGDLTEVHENQHVSGRTVWMGRNSSPSGAETPGASWSGSSSGNFAVVKCVST